MDLTEVHGQEGLLTIDKPSTMKEITQIISDLKKDNFNLRLRIFYYEQGLQQKCDASVEEMYKTNIDLKVEVDTLKSELKDLQIVTSPLLENSSELMDIRIMLEKEVRDLAAMLEQERMRVVELENEIQSYSQSDTLTQTDAPPPPPPQDQDTDQNLLFLLQEKDTLIEQLQASVKSQDAMIDQLRNSGAGQGSGDQPANDADRQLSSLIDLQEQDHGRERRKYDRQLKEMQDMLERSTEEISEKDFLLAESEFKLRDQDTTIQKLKRKLQEKDELLQLASEKDSPQNDKSSEKEEVVDLNNCKKDIIAQLQACLQEKEKELQTLNNLLFSHEDTIHTLENELADEKVKYDSNMKELQDALEQSNEEIAEMSFLLTENDIKMKEQEATIQTLDGKLKEKDQLPQVYTCSESTTQHQQDSLLQQQLRELEDASERAREEMLSVTEEKDREINRLQSSLLEIQMNPPTHENLLSHIQDAINSAKDEILTAIKWKGNDNSSNLSLLLQKMTELQARNDQLSSFQELINRLGDLMREGDLEVDQTRDVFERLQRAKQELEESLSQMLHDKDRTIIHLQDTLNRKAGDMEVMASHLQTQTEESSRELEQLEKRLRETEAMLAQTTAEKQRQLTDHQFTLEELQSAINVNAEVLKDLESLMKGMDRDLHPVRDVLRRFQQAKEAPEGHISHIFQEKDFVISQLQEVANKKSQHLEVMVGRLQNQTDDSNKELEQLEQRLKETQAMLVQTKQEKEIQLSNCQLEIEKLQGQAEESNRNVEQMELRLKEMEDILVQTSEKQLEENQLTEEKLQGQTENSNRKLEQLELRLKETEDMLAEANDDKEKQLTHCKLTMEAILVQTKKEKEIQLSNCQLEIETLQGQAEESNQNVEQLELRLKEMEDILVQTSEKQLEDNQLTEEKLQGQTEDSNRKLEQLELRLKETEDMLAEANDDKEKQLTHCKLTIKEQHSQTEDSSRQLKHLDEIWKEKEVMLAQTTVDKDRQLTDYKLTVGKLLTTITVNEQMFKELSEHHNQVLARHSEERQDFERRQEQLSIAQTHISDTLQEKWSEVCKLKEHLAEREIIIKGLKELAVQGEMGRTKPWEKESLDPNHTTTELHTSRENREALLGDIGSARCDRCLQILQRENGSLLDRLGASECFTQTLQSQLDLFRTIMAQREKDMGYSFTTSSITVDKETEDDRCMAKMNQNQVLDGQLQELLRLRQQLQETFLVNERLGGQLENHRAQTQTQTKTDQDQTGAQTETGPDQPGLHPEMEASEFTQLQREYNTLREEREGLREDLTYAQDKNRTLESSLCSTQEEIHRLKGAIDAYQTQLTHSHELLKMLPVEMQESKQLKASTVSPTDSDSPKLSQLLSEIQKIKAQLTDKDVLQMKPTEEKLLERSSWPECPPKIININYVECGPSGHTRKSNYSDTRRRDHAKKDNDNISQSSQSMDDSVPSSLNSSLSTLCYEKTPHVTAQDDDYTTLQSLVSEGKTLPDKMIKLLQECSNNSHPESQSPVDQKFMKHLSATISANKHALEEACHLLKIQGRSSHLKSDCVNNGQTKEDFYWENLKLKNEIERLRREQSQNKNMLSEAVKRLKRVNRRKLERLID